MKQFFKVVVIALAMLCSFSQMSEAKVKKKKKTKTAKKSSTKSESPELSTKDFGWYYLQKNVPGFAEQNWTKYLPPEHEISMKFSNAIGIDGVTCASYQLKDGTTYVVFFYCSKQDVRFKDDKYKDDKVLGNVPFHAINAKEYRGSFEGLRNSLLEKLGKQYY